MKKQNGIHKSNSNGTWTFYPTKLPFKTIERTYRETKPYERRSINEVQIYLAKKYGSCKTLKELKVAMNII